LSDGGDWDQTDSDIDDRSEYEFKCPECDRTITDDDTWIEQDEPEGEDEDLVEDPPEGAVRLESLRKEHFRHGMRLTCSINEHHNVHCIVTLEGDRVYLCQNVTSGADCADKQGMPFSWLVTTQGVLDLRGNGVRNIVIGDWTAEAPAPQANEWGGLL
jgi:hypothetical protein